MQSINIRFENGKVNIIVDGALFKDVHAGLFHHRRVYIRQASYTDKLRMQALAQQLLQG